MDANELRALNKDAVAKYFELHGLQRLELFTDDGAKVIPFNPSYLKVFRWQGREQLRENFEYNSRDLSDWRFYDLEIIPGEDPNFFLVKVKGEGHHSNGDFYKNFYLFTFTCREGKLVEVTEYMNPVNGMVAAGFSIPSEYLWDRATMPFSAIEIDDLA